jgi:hypothetical protein
MSAQLSLADEREHLLVVNFALSGCLREQLVIKSHWGALWMARLLQEDRCPLRADGRKKEGVIKSRTFGSAMVA